MPGAFWKLPPPIQKGETTYEYKPSLMTLLNLSHFIGRETRTQSHINIASDHRKHHIEHVEILVK